MGRRAGTLLIAVAASLLLAGCVAMGGIDRTADTIDRSAGAARNNSILLNIVRASRREPLYFYSISHVSGSGIEDFKLSLPPVSLGPHRTAAQRNFTIGTNGLNVLDSSRSGSFDVALLESKNFYQGMLDPLELLEINLLLKQGFPRELVYRLAVQDVTVYDESGLHRFVNDPASSSYPQFNFFMAAAMSHGITTETFLQEHGAAGDDAAPGKPHASAKTAAARLCVDPTLADPAAADDIRQSGNQCGKRPVVLAATDEARGALDFESAYAACRDLTAGAASTEAQHNRVCAHLNGKVIITQLNTRSLFGIFQYLGGLLASGKDSPLMGLGAAPEAHTTGPLLSIIQERRDDCFANVTWGARYCVPRSGSDNLKQVFSMINALQALKTAPGDLPATTSVRIEQ